jgi:16S rRNA G527 N7-methylase RsmG
MLKPDIEFMKEYHLTGIESRIITLLRKRSMKRVLDVGAGIGFWSFIIRGYLKLDDQNLVLIGWTLIKVRSST